MAGSNSSPEADLGDVIFAIASDVGQHWKSLVDLLGMDARRDVQKIQHECSKAHEGSSSFAQRCAEHMFALWRSRLAQSGVSDRQATDSLIFALQATPQLAYLADRCNDMLGLKSQTSQAEVDRQLSQTADSGMFSSLEHEHTEPPESMPFIQPVQEGTPSLPQGQYRPPHAVSTTTATPTSHSHNVHTTVTVSQTPSRDSASVVASPRSNHQYHSAGMTGLNSFEAPESLPLPEPQASGGSVSSGSAPLPTAQQYSRGSTATPVNLSARPSESLPYSSSTTSQPNSSPPPEQPQPPQAQAAALPVAAALVEQPPRAGHDQQLHDESPKSTDSGVDGQEHSIPNVIDLGQRDSLFLVLDVCLRLRRRKMLAHFLGLDISELDDIMKNEVEPEEQSFQIIKKWTEKKGEEATFSELKQALIFIKEQACLDCMQNINI